MSTILHSSLGDLLSSPFRPFILPGYILKIPAFPSCLSAYSLYIPLLLPSFTSCAARSFPSFLICLPSLSKRVCIPPSLPCIPPYLPPLLYLTSHPLFPFPSLFVSALFTSLPLTLSYRPSTLPIRLPLHPFSFPWCIYFLAPFVSSSPLSLPPGVVCLLSHRSISPLLPVYMPPSITLPSCPTSAFPIPSRPCILFTLPRLWLTYFPPSLPSFTSISIK